jgi:outer membrane cobalamin receptor
MPHSDRRATLRQIGVVLDSRTGEPVPYAWVRDLTTDTRADGDSVGRFTLDLRGDPQLLVVEAGRVGYVDGRWDRVRPDRFTTLFLQQASLELKGISVNAFRMPVSQAKAGPVWILDREALQPRGRLTVADVLGGTPSLFSKDYGNLATVGLRGASAEQTLVLLDGVRLNSSQDNLADLSTIPLNRAGRIEVVRGGSSALYGTSSIGGLVSISTPDPEALTAMGAVGLGSQGKRYAQFRHGNWLNPFGYMVAGSVDRTDRTFRYRATSGETLTRLNSDAANAGAMLKLKYERSRHSTGLLVDYNHTARGAPGPTDRPTDSARTDDDRLIAHLGYAFQETDNARLEAKVFHHQFLRRYGNPDTFAWANDTHATAVSGLTVKQTAHLSNWASAAVGIDGGQERFRSTAIGTPLRLSGAGWAEARLKLWAFDLVPMVRRTADSALPPTETRALSPKIAVGYSGPAWLNAYASVGRSFRAPTFNELYWPTDPWTRGNPSLKPEWATSVDACVSARNRSLTGRLGVWHSALTDLIQWQVDSSSTWKPVNLDTATVTGAEVELGFLSKHVSVVGSTTYMLARSHGKDLIYRPRLNFAVSHALSWELVQVSWDVRHTGERFTDIDNTASLPAFLLFDVGATITPAFGRLATVVRGGVRNLFDKQYEIIKGYPLPGRNWYAELEVRL